MLDLECFNIKTERGLLACALSSAGPADVSRSELRGSLSTEGVLVLVHASPTGSKDSAPLPALAAGLKCATLRFDLAGCGESGGSPRIGAYARDVEDIRTVVEHIRSTLHRQVLGLLGYAEGGTAVLQYATKYQDVPNIVTLGARIVHSDWFERCLTWSQVQSLKDAGKVDWSFVSPAGAKVRLEVTHEDLGQRPALEELPRCSGVRFLALHGSLDEKVPPSNMQTLEDLLGGHGGFEARVIPGVGHEWAGHEDTLCYAVTDWLWRQTRQARADGELASDEAPPLANQPSGYNIFVDNLALQVKEIHAAARSNLPSMAADGADDSDGDDEEPLVSAQARKR